MRCNPEESASIRNGESRFAPHVTFTGGSSRRQLSVSDRKASWGLSLDEKSSSEVRTGFFLGLKPSFRDEQSDRYQRKRKKTDVNPFKLLTLHVHPSKKKKKTLEGKFQLSHHKFILQLCKRSKAFPPTAQTGRCLSGE